MKMVSVCLCISMLSDYVYGQSTKPVIDTAAVSHWHSLRNSAINSNGTYIAYILSEAYSRNPVLHVQSVTSGWKKEIPDIIQYKFSANGAFIVCTVSNNDLIILKLGSAISHYIPAVSSYELSHDKKEERLIYLNAAQQLVFSDLNGKIKQVYHSIVSYTCISAGAKVIMTEKDGARSKIKLITDKGVTAFRDNFTNVEPPLISKDGSKFAFLATTPDDDAKQVYYTDLNKEPLSIVRLDNDSLTVDRIEGFTPDARQLIVSKLRNIEKKRPDEFVKVWNYQDKKLNFGKTLPDLEKPQLITIDLVTLRSSRIGNDSITVDLSANLGNNFLLEYLPYDGAERYWKKERTDKYYLAGMNERQQTEIPVRPYSISPDGKFLIGGGRVGDHFIAYHHDTGDTIVIGRTTASRWLLIDSLADVDNGLRFFAGWRGPNKLLVYDTYDIWEIDLEKQGTQKNLTNGFGRKNKLVLRFATDPEDKIYTAENTRILSAFNVTSKQNGFYHLNEQVGDPLLLSMEDAFYNFPGTFGEYEFYPIKAKDRDVWLVRKQTAEQAPNYFITGDFKNFRQLTDIKPALPYNWLKTMLLDFKMNNGKSNQAILYKPEDFDSSKKYPVIITYYEKVSNKLNIFLTPELSQNQINIPWFVSRGYIVCTPDIIYRAGEPGQSALDAVNGVADLLSTLPYVDTTKMAVHGHSFGGYETDYIIAHTNRFTAAMASSATTNLVSDFNGTWGGASSKQESYEFGQFGMALPLWERPDLYIKSSPIFDVQNIHTPLLMMNNREDGAVDFSQGLAFFTSLRRLGKPVWMLEYQHASHSLFNAEHRYDYTRKLEGFFGYFLKSQPMPDWMKP